MHHLNVGKLYQRIKMTLLSAEIQGENFALQQILKMQILVPKLI